MRTIIDRLDNLEQRVGALEASGRGIDIRLNSLLEDVRSVGETLVAIRAAWESLGETGAGLAGAVIGNHPLDAGG